ncbi:Bug family tripartite tricarboxylate transporter substrate binding protein [Enterovirga rhinocerotis]|uniref:Tripartite-type tricarboxylate transporter receptor subunit TctC n=1 Tax=Enterovirga rhinocerotis TaxID=1339210 RepID=A0A4R7C8F5_9HYPH|nr:tripartite tricarboxylate transporter substrate binding protein [Enterovirga rhinocerotis]TDR94914.1 tripartite-type tricarboxylate transporter receptor subunit TctC [Enterovirga rhinocerotis]
MIRFAAMLLAAGLAVSPLAAGALEKAEWPSRIIRIIVPFGAGSTPDSAARLLADKLEPKLGQRVIVENKAGASGNLGTDAVAKAEPDGYTLGLSIVGPLAINPLLFPTMPYDPARDLTPISVLGGQPNVLVVNNDVPAKSVEDLLALLRRDPERYNFASIGNGSLSHLAMEAILIKAGAKVTHVPFPGSPAALTSLIRGDVQMAVLAAGNVMPHVEDGRIRALAVSLAERSPLIPSLPTLKESGIEGVEADAWVGLIGPAGLPEPIVARLVEAVKAAVADPDMAAKLRAQYIAPRGSTPAEFRALLADERARWEPVIRRNGIRMGQ